VGGDRSVMTRRNVWGLSPVRAGKEWRIEGGEYEALQRTDWTKSLSTWDAGAREGVWVGRRDPPKKESKGTKGVEKNDVQKRTQRTG